MRRSHPLRAVLLLACLAAAAVLAVLAASGFGATTRASSSGAAPANGAAAVRTFVGKVKGTHAFIGVVVGRRVATAYVCDSKNVANWLSGRLHKAKRGSARQAVLRTKAGRDLVYVTVTSRRAAGFVLQVHHARHSFSARPATGDAGLFRLEKTLNGQDFLGGWIRLNDGSVRGRVKNTTTGTVVSDPISEQQVTGGTPGGVPPGAINPIPLDGPKRSQQCSSDLLFYNDMVKSINRKGGFAKATKQAQLDLGNLVIDIGIDCPAGTIGGEPTVNP